MSQGAAASSLDADHPTSDGSSPAALVQVLDIRRLGDEEFGPSTPTSTHPYANVFTEEEFLSMHNTPSDHVLGDPLYVMKDWAGDLSFSGSGKADAWPLGWEDTLSLAWGQLCPGAPDQRGSPLPIQQNPEESEIEGSRSDNVIQSGPEGPRISIPMMTVTEGSGGTSPYPTCPGSAVTMCSSADDLDAQCGSAGAPFVESDLRLEPRPDSRQMIDELAFSLMEGP